MDRGEGYRNHLWRIAGSLETIYGSVPHRITVGGRARLWRGALLGALTKLLAQTSNHDRYPMGDELDCAC